MDAQILTATVILTLMASGSLIRQDLVMLSLKNRPSGMMLTATAMETILSLALGSRTLALPHLGSRIETGGDVRTRMATELQTHNSNSAGSLTQ
jgi:hypothetical protein